MATSVAAAARSEHLGTWHSLAWSDGKIADTQRPKVMMHVCVQASFRFVFKGLKPLCRRDSVHEANIMSVCGHKQFRGKKYLLKRPRADRSAVLTRRVRI